MGIVMILISYGGKRLPLKLPSKKGEGQLDDQKAEGQAPAICRWGVGFRENQKGRSPRQGLGKSNEGSLTGKTKYDND